MLHFKPNRLFQTVLLLFLGLFAFSQKNDFYPSMREGIVGTQIYFNHEMYSALNFQWDFNGDSIPDSQEMNPMYAYSEPGTYSVTLWFEDPINGPMVVTKPNLITIYDPSVPVIWADMTKVKEGDYSNFYVNAPNAVEIAIDFDFPSGIDTVDVDLFSNMYYVNYRNPGIYSVALYYSIDGTVYDSVLRNMYIDVQRIEPDFRAMSGQTGLAPFYASIESDLPEYKNIRWDFTGDGAVDMEGWYVNWEFPTPGSYDVTMFWDEDGQTRQMTKAGFITVIDPNGPAEFWAGQTEGHAPLYVYFQTTLPDTIALEWDFDNDGAVDSYERYPSYEYRNPGQYSVRLSWMEGTLPREIIKNNYINVLGDQQFPEFWADVPSGFAPHSTMFHTNLPMEAQVSWDFNRDGIADKSGTDVDWLFDMPGLYDVTVYWVDSLQNPMEITLYGMIDVKQNNGTGEPQFWADVPSGFAPLSTMFHTNLPMEAQVSWDFNRDGIADKSGTDVDWLFDMPGLYDVTVYWVESLQNPMEITLYGMIDVKQNNGTGEPQFWADVPSGFAPLSTMFHTNLPMEAQVSWDFNRDGIADKSGTDVDWLFDMPGLYDVTVYWVDSLQNPMEITLYGMIDVKQNNGTGEPQFWADVPSGFAPLSTMFHTNLPMEAQVSWDFNRDGIADRTGTDVDWLFEMPGLYDVTVYWVDSLQDPNEATFYGMINVYDSLVQPEFYADVNSGYGPLWVNFYSMNIPLNTIVGWDFDNDGSIDAEGHSASHEFIYPGWYSITMYWMGADSIPNQIYKQNLIEVYQNSFDFYAYPSQGITPLFVEFQSYLPDTIEKFWDFNNDGVIDTSSTGSYFYNTYTEPGWYSVGLYWIDTNGDTAYTVQYNIVEVITASQIVGDFYLYPTSGIAPLYVYLEVQLPNEVQNISWDFNNDGSIDTVGRYVDMVFDGGVHFVDIAMIWEYQGYVDTVWRQFEVTVIDTTGGTVDFWADSRMGYAPYYVFFQTTLDENTTVEWDMNGDGTIDTQGNYPSWEYMNPGLYTVTMFWYDANNVQQSITKQNYIDIKEHLNTNPSFWADMYNGSVPFVTRFQTNLDPSLNVAWDFNMDGVEDAFGTEAWFTFYDPGMYDVTIYWDDNGNRMQLTQYGMISVQENGNPLEPTCETAVQAFLGLNEYPANAGAQGYLYTATQSGQLLLDACNLPETVGYLDFEVFDGCNYTYLEYDRNYCDNGNAIMIVDVQEGQSIFIIARAYSPEPFAWSLRMHTPQPGEDCNNPIVARVGLNTVNHWGVSEEMYFQYIPTQNGIVTVSSCDETDIDTWFYVFKGGACNGGTFVSMGDDQCGNQPRAVFQVQAGELISITWASNDVNAIHNWTLSFEQGVLPPGTACDNAIQAFTGENFLYPTDMLVWYDYTARETGKVILSANPNDVDRLAGAEVEIFSNCNLGDEAPSRTNFADTSVWAWAEAGEVLKIVWILESTMPDRIPFFITEEPQPIPEGSLCRNAIPLAEGPASTPGITKNTWFTYTPQEDGLLTISNCGYGTNYHYTSFYIDCYLPILDKQEDYCENGQYNTSAFVHRGEPVQISIHQDYVGIMDFEVIFTPATDTELYGFRSDQQIAPPIIDRSNNLILLEVGAYVDLHNIYLYPKVAFGAHAYLNAMPFNEKNVYPVSFADTNVALLRIDAYNGVDFSEWTIVVSKASEPQSGADLFSFRYGNHIGQPGVDSVVHLNLGYSEYDCQEVNFEISPMARLFYANNGNYELYRNNFECLQIGSNLLKVVAEDGSEKFWEVHIMKLDPLPGEVCATALPFDGLIFNGQLLRDNWIVTTIPETGYYGVENNFYCMIQTTACDQSSPQIYKDEWEDLSLYLEAGTQVAVQVLNSGMFNFSLTPQEASSENILRYAYFYDYDNVDIFIDNAAGKLTATFPYSVNLSDVGIAMGTGSDAEIFFNDSTAGNHFDMYLDLTMPHTFTVVAQNGDVRTYELIIEQLPPRIGNDIRAFELQAQVLPSIIDVETASVYSLVPSGTLVNEIILYFSLSPGAKAMSAVGQRIQPGMPLRYMPGMVMQVVAENGSVKVWNIIIEEENDSTAVDPISVTFALSGIQLEETQVFQTAPTVLPLNASDKSITFVSTDNTVASVNEFGLITAVSAGVADIVVQTVVGGHSDTLHVQVLQPRVQQIFIDPSYITLLPGDMLNVPLFYEPSGLEPPLVEFAVEDQTVATVANGVIEALAAGRTLVQVLGVENTALYAEFTVEVIESEIPVSNIAVERPVQYLPTNGQTQIMASIVPLNATYQGLLYQSSNPEVAVVDQMGRVSTGGILDTAVITISSIHYPEIFATVLIIVDREDDVLVSEVRLPDSIVVDQGQTVRILPQVFPDNATVKQLNWISFDENIASISTTGYVAGVNEGRADVIAIATDGSGVASNPCKVIVRNIPVQSISLNIEGDFVMNPGDVESGFVVNFVPQNASNKAVLWSSSDEAIVNVTSTGVIYAREVGSATIAVASLDNPDAFDMFNVVVIPAVANKDELRIAKSDAVSRILYAQELMLIGTNPGQYPQSAVDALQMEVDIASALLLRSDATQSEVDAQTITLLAAIELFELSKFDAILVDSINIMRSVLNITKSSAPVQLTAQVFPADASMKVLAWRSSNPSVATVSRGIVTPVGAGTTVVYATATDGSHEFDSVIVSVIVPVAEIILPSSFGVEVGSSIQLNAAILPQNATNKTLLWSIDNPAVATVSASGILTGISSGFTNVRVTSENGLKSAFAIVAVVDRAIPVTGISLPESANMVVGEERVASATVLPFNATDKSVVWASSSTSIVSVSSTGILEAVATGEAYVYGTTVDGDFSDSIYVVVRPSLAPITSAAVFSLRASDDSLIIRLRDFVSDDNTVALNLQVVGTSAVFNLRDTAGYLILSKTEMGFVGTEIINATVTDKDGQSSQWEITVVVSDAVNTEPILLPLDSLFVKQGRTIPVVNLLTKVSDDYTAPADIQWSVINSTNLYARIVDGFAEITVLNDAFVGIESIQIIAYDEDQASDTAILVVEVSDKVDEAPVVVGIPNQTQTDSTSFGNINLADYINDDFTSLEDLTIVVSDNARVSVNIVDGILSAEVTDPTWTGSETITIIIIDENGNESEISVTYTQESSVGSEDWESVPAVSFTADKTRVGVGESVIFHASISGSASLGYVWSFEAGTPESISALNPQITFNTPGRYAVSFQAANEYGTGEATEDEYITVVGISTPDTVVCIGSVVELTCSDNALTAYNWSTGSNSFNTSVEVVSDTVIYLNSAYGLFNFADSVVITVAPVLNLPENTEICAGDIFTITAEGFEEYNWNGTGFVAESSFTQVMEVGKTILEVIDVYGCSYTDSTEITAVNPLPVIDFAETVTECLGNTVTLDASNFGTSYLWSDSSIVATASIDTDSIVWVEVTDNNGCMNSDTVTVVINKPYKEELQVATFSETSSAVIIAWERTPGARTEKYEVLRETSVAGVYEVIATSLFNTPSYYVDNYANALQQAYRYKLRTYDSVCGNSVESEVHRTLHLQTSYSHDDALVNLEWTQYEGVDVPTYFIKRIAANGSESTIAELSGADNTFTDVNPVPNTSYRVVFDLPRVIDPATLGVDASLKSDSGPYSQSLSNLAESGVATSINPLAKATVIAYPNPATDFVSVTVQTDNAVEVTVSLKSSLGITVLAPIQVVSGSAAILSLEGLATGNYSIILESGEVSKTIPLVVH